LHFAYDTVWMALPLFVSSSGRARIEQMLVVIAVFIPVWVVLASRVRSAAWREVPIGALNGAWRPAEVAEVPPPVATPVFPPTSIPSSVLKALPIAGLTGLLIWLLVSPFHTDAPPVNVTRGEAEQQAREALARRGIQLDASWRVLGYVEGQPGEINRFVWQTVGRDVYRKLLGVYVTPPGWVVRFARFEGDVAERAEEYHVYIGNQGPFRVSHDLPEARSGKTLSEEEARRLAMSVLTQPSDFEEVSAQAKKRPARTDWTFVFKDKQGHELPQGEPRISVAIAGDEVADTARYVYVPEDWSRNERARRNLPVILSIVCTIVIIAMATGGAIVGAIHWSRRRSFSARAFFVVFGAVFFLSALNALNNWPATAARAETSQPLELQAGIVVAASLLVAIFTAAGLGLLAGLVANDLDSPKRLPLTRSFMVAASLGFAMVGAGALVRQLGTSMSPDWGNLGPASTFLPVLSAALSPLSVFFVQALILLTVLYVLGRRPRGAAAWLVVGIALAGSSSVETIPSWLLVGATTGLALGIAYALVFRHHPELFPITVATVIILSTLRDGMQRMYPSALIGSLAGATLVAIVVWVWFRGSMDKSVLRS
jgi:hypothetical protein